MRRTILAGAAAIAVAAAGLVAAPAGAADVTPLEVVVTNRGGGPLYGAEVAVRQGGAVVASGESDARGRLTTNLPTGTYQVTVTFADGCVAIAPGVSDVVLTAGSTQRLNLALDGPSVVSGRVTSKQLPVAGARIYLDSLDLSEVAKADADGWYSFTLCDDSEWLDGGSLSADWGTGGNSPRTYSGPTGRRADGTGVGYKRDSWAERNFELYSSLGNITGKVVDSKGRPVAGVWVEAKATDRNAFGVSTGKTAADGTYRIPGLPHGSYKVTSRKGAAERSVAVKVTTGRTGTANIKLPPGTIPGKISAKVSVPKQIEEHVQTGVTVKDSKGRTVGEYGPFHNGKTTVSYLAPGRYRVYLDGTGISKQVKVTKGKTTRISFTRPVGTKITGTVRWANGKAFAKRSLIAYDSRGGVLATVKTNARGEYTIRGAMPGKYRITAWHAESDLGRGTTVTVKKGKNAKASWRFVKTGTITGTVLNSQGSPARGVEVAAYDSRGHEVSISLGHTDDQGRYSLKVKPGKLTLRTVDPTDGGIGYFHGKAKVTAKKGTSVAAPTITVKGP
ncbi:carboxypeptidase regulatory-like domain-containing protein [Sanguibacter hominis ATCC BAA-789]|uniref:Carboxypeptidase regulatory-like domain-containing protein n=1 Tax=Sanguibacter hominis ATCC BAA-789 TaxID=1312740 RepID=A0A9X5FH35_9MICO|nr:carboxypeptidase-like regulatory domain-containing protein [Sanguibacter hominis]NKX94111.1 carboxypeptidase regulatory-like domain-containing protein [Sanguibacter hominis ATCC BAA-789]